MSRTILFESEMRKTPHEFDEVKEMVASKLDWNLVDAEVIAYRITSDWRIQVVVLDHCWRGASDTREYLEALTDLADKHRIDLTVVHAVP